MGVGISLLTTCPLSALCLYTAETYVKNMSMEPTTKTPSGVLARVLGGMSPTEVGKYFVHFLIGLPIAIVGFVLTLVFGILSFALLILYPIALPIMVAWLAIMYSFGTVDRWRVGALLGWPVEGLRPFKPGGTLHTRLWMWVRRPVTWRIFGYNMARLPVGIIGFAVTWSLLYVALAFFTMPIQFMLSSVSFVQLGPLLYSIGSVIIALAILVVLSRVLRIMAELDAALAHALLGPSETEQMGERIEHLSDSRSRMVDAAEHERRRIERDLHDGAGQQLVALAMTLGMARQKLEDNPEQARSLIDEAHSEAKHALGGLRDIVRGISPAILSDRGLGPALSAVAARSRIPISITIDVSERPGPSAEGIAYYIVCEGISNAIRHTNAETVKVSVLREGDQLSVEVRDDGDGGADPTRGTGLQGLVDRVDAIDGGLVISSPEGGPTILKAQLPVGDVSVPERSE